MNDRGRCFAVWVSGGKEKSVWRDRTREMQKHVEEKMELGTAALTLSFTCDFLKSSLCDSSNHIAGLLFKHMAYFWPRMSLGIPKVSP